MAIWPEGGLRYGPEECKDLPVFVLRSYSHPDIDRVILRPASGRSEREPADAATVDGQRRALPKLFEAYGPATPSEQATAEASSMGSETSERPAKRARLEETRRTMRSESSEERIKQSFVKALRRAASEDSQDSGEDTEKEDKRKDILSEIKDLRPEVESILRAEEGEDDLLQQEEEHPSIKSCRLMDEEELESEPGTECDELDYEVDPEEAVVRRVDGSIIEGILQERLRKVRKLRGLWEKLSCLQSESDFEEREEDEDEVLRTLRDVETLLEEIRKMPEVENEEGDAGSDLEEVAERGEDDPIERLEAEVFPEESEEETPLDESDEDLWSHSEDDAFLEGLFVWPFPQPFTRT